MTMFMAYHNTDHVAELMCCDIHTTMALVCDATKSHNESETQNDNNTNNALSF